MFNYDRAIYRTIDDEIQLCLIMIEIYIKNWGWNTTLLIYHSGIYKTINDEIQLC